MKALLDVSPAVNGKAGLGRYAGSLARAIGSQHPGGLCVFANAPAGSHWPTDLDGLPRSSIRAGYKPWRLAVLAAQIAGVGFNRLLPDRVSVFHATEHLLLPLHGIPQIMTVHDVIFRLYPEHHKRLNYWYLSLAMPVFLRRARHLIAVSEATKRDLVRLYHVPAEKIAVIAEAAAPHFRPQPPERVESVRVKYGLVSDYIIAVGTIEPRKNLPRLVEALAIVRETHPGLKLVVAGAKGWLYDGFYDAIRHTGQHEAIRQTGYVPDEDLPALLAGACCAIVPSLYEGFGLPVLEAMACGVPVACSATSSLGELAGSAALTFDPEDPRVIAEAISQVVSSRSLQEDLRQRGLEHAGTYSWEKAARETWAIYEGVVNDS